MISSRCNDRFPANDRSAPALSDIRRDLKTEIETTELFGKKSFEVWINEETPPQGGRWDSWEVCVQAVKDCDILLVLSNGNAGWAKNGGDIGICHEEYKTGFDLAPGKVWLISLGDIKPDKSPQGERNRRFQDYLATQTQFRGGEVRTIDDLKERVRAALRNAVITLVQRGVREASKGRFHSGQALNWSRMDFGARQSEMVRVIRESILQRGNGSTDGGNLFVKLGVLDVLLVPHAIPAALTISAAKEMVGQPFLRDYQLSDALKGNRVGPVHLIGCHKAANEAQAARLLGFPDAEFVSAPFGIYAADNVQKVQFAFLADCRDESNTRDRVQRFFEWLEQTGEDALLAKRAAARAKIVKTIAQEL